MGYAVNWTPINISPAMDWKGGPSSRLKSRIILFVPGDSSWNLLSLLPPSPLTAGLLAAATFRKRLIGIASGLKAARSNWPGAATVGRLNWNVA